MDTKQNEPKSLQEAILYFADADRCLAYIVARRWPNGVTCPVCGSSEVYFTASRRVWQCKNVHAKRQFTVKTGTVMEDSAVTLDKWMVALWMVVNCKNGVSSYEIARALRITQKSAWFMLHRVRKTMQDDSIGRLSGEVEVDETFIGGKARNMHVAQRRRRITGTGMKDKTAVLGLLERGGQIRTTVVPSRRKNVLQKEVNKHVEAGAALYTDALKSYSGLEKRYAHGVIDHAVKYVDGKIHTNGLENFWSLLKRGISGTYVSVEPFHLFRYLDEQSFRYNNRHFANDGERFSAAVSHIAGKRLTYKELTGKNVDATWVN
jgi:transposase-like protein